MSESENKDIYSMIAQYVDSVHSVINERFSMIDERNETVDKQLANMTVAFGEMSVMIEALVASLSTDTFEDARKIFDETVAKGRKVMLGVMEGFYDVMAGRDTDIGGPVEDVVEDDNINGFEQ